MGKGSGRVRRMGESDRATMVGFLALVFWSMMFGFVRLTSQGFGVLLGGALIYTLGAISLFIVLRPSRPSAYSLKYFLVSGGLFVFYEAAISASIGLAASSTQTVELSMVNYLWPSFTVLLNSTAMRGARGFARALPGAAVATVGVMLAIGGDAGLDAGVVAADISSNPLPFALTLAAALAWASYSVVTPRITNGKDATPYFMIGVAAVFWVMFATSGAPVPQSMPSTGSILALLAAMGSIAAGYACWNHGLLFGNVSRMALASYAAPFLSVTASSIILGLALPGLFWAGVAFVVAGSLLNLLMGADGDFQGKIFLDDRDIREIAPESLYEMISVIQQNVFIFNASIRDNVTMFREFPPEEVSRALAGAHLSGLLAERGEDYLCGENGRGLSGGERQRVSIARCLLKHSSVLLVDEATAALDPQTAHQVSGDILDLSDVTRVVVTHTLEEALLRRYDGILVLKDGRVAEAGDFETLMANKGYFYALFTVAQ